MKERVGIENISPVGLGCDDKAEIGSADATDEIQVLCQKRTSTRCLCSNALNQLREMTHKLRDRLECAGDGDGGRSQPAKKLGDDWKHDPSEIPMSF